MNDWQQCMTNEQVYIAETSEYIWYVTVIHNMVYTFDVALKLATTPTRL